MGLSNNHQPAKGGPPRQPGALGSLVEAEKMVQLALMIPSATVIGWLAGLGLDHLLHQHWIYIAGLLFGATAGFVQLFRTVLKHTKE
jgi:F0F1-type ATP synthase assembly protein I